MPYDEQFILNRVGPTFFDLYRQRGRVFGDDPQSVVWPARTQADIDMGMAPEMSLAKHAAECRQALGVIQPPPSPVPGPSPLIQGRLRRAGRWLANDAGRFQVRGLSAFRLCQMVSRGEDITPFLDWAQANGFNWLRVFTSAVNMFPLHPSAGLAALPTVLTLAAQRGSYVEVVCLADVFDANGNRSWPDIDPALHVRSVGIVCAPFENAVVEGANEPRQRWQAFDPATLDGFMSQMPPGLAYTLGANDGPSDELREYLRGNIAWHNVHADRTRAPWGNVRHVREQQVMADSVSIYVVNDEPEKNLTDAQQFAMGAICRVGGIGDTFHSEFGKHCRLPTAAEQTQVNFRRRGWNAVPASFGGQFTNFSWTAPLPESPVAGFSAIDNDSRAYGRTDGTTAYVALTHARNPVWRGGWTGVFVDGVDQGGGEVAAVYRCTRV